MSLPDALYREHQVMNYRSHSPYRSNPSFKLLQALALNCTRYLYAGAYYPLTHQESANFAIVSKNLSTVLRSFAYTGVCDISDIIRYFKDGIS